MQVFVEHLLHIFDWTKRSIFAARFVAFEFARVDLTDRQLVDEQLDLVVAVFVFIVLAIVVAFVEHKGDI